MIKKYYGNELYHAEQRNHKYVRREFVNGKWRYFYADDLDDRIKEANETEKRFSNEHAENYAIEENRIYKRLSKNGRKVNRKRVKRLLERSAALNLLKESANRADKNAIELEDIKNSRRKKK